MYFYVNTSVIKYMTRRSTLTIDKITSVPPPGNISVSYGRIDVGGCYFMYYADVIEDHKTTQNKRLGHVYCIYN